MKPLSADGYCLNIPIPADIQEPKASSLVSTTSRTENVAAAPATI